MRLPPDVLIAISLGGHCTTATNDTCTDSTWLHSRGLGRVKRGERVTLRVQWTAITIGSFFQRDEDLEVFAPYTLSDTAPPGRPRKGLWARVRGRGSLPRARAVSDR